MTSGIELLPLRTREAIREASAPRQSLSSDSASAIVAGDRRQLKVLDMPIEDGTRRRRARRVRGGGRAAEAEAGDGIECPHARPAGRRRRRLRQGRPHPLPQCRLPRDLGSFGRMARLRPGGERHPRPAPRRPKAAGAVELPRLALKAPRRLSERRAARGSLASAGRPHAARRGGAEFRRRHELHLRERHRADHARKPARGAVAAAGRDARPSLRGGGGVRHRRQAAPVQSRLRRYLAAVADAASRPSRISARSSPPARRSIPTRRRGTRSAPP